VEPGVDTLPAGRGSWSWETWIFAAALICSAGLILYAGRRMGFYYDEWQYLQFRRGGDLGTYLDPHNGHLSLIPVAIYKLLFATIGIDHYWPYRVVLLIFHLTTCVLLFVLVRRRLGDRAALIAGLLLVLMASSSENLLWAFQLDFVGSIAAGLGAFVMLDRPSRRNDRWACVLVIVSLACSSLGVAFLIGVAVELLLEPYRRRQLWIVVLPGALFGLWLLGWGDGGQLMRENLGAMTQYVADSASAVAAGIFGLPSWGQVLLVGGAVAVAVLRRGDPLAPIPSPRLAGLVVTILTFWSLTALSRAQLHEPDAPRYLYLGAVMLMLIVASLLPRPRTWSGWMTATTIVLLGFILLGNAYRLRDAERFFRGIWEPLRGSLAAFEVAGTHTPPTMAPNSPSWPNLTAGPYLAAVRDNGSPTGGGAWLIHASERQRQIADAQLVAAEAIDARPVDAAPISSGAAPDVEQPASGTVRAGTSCVRFAPTASDGALTLQLRPGASIAIEAADRAPASVQVRRFADELTSLTTAVAGGSTAVLATVLDGAPTVPWHVRITSSGRVRVCSTSG